MEIELKYKLISHLLADKIWKEFGGEGIGCRYIGAYYDTPDMGLAKDDIIFRIRSEEEEYVATLKWNGVEDFGLYEREEVNVNLGPNPPNIISREIFRNTKAFYVIEKFEKELKPVVEIDFARRKTEKAIGKSILELAVDVGEIKVSGRTAPICELEIELKEGNKGDLMKFGKELSETYKLQQEAVSKFARGMELLKREN